MSHTTSISAIVISDQNALRRAVAELKSNGVKCDLLENAKPRAYYADQQGMGVAAFVVQLHDAKYDVGLYQNNEIGGLEARSDFFGGTVERVLGVEAISGKDSNQAKLGKLYQAYAVCAAEQQAFAQGYTPAREYNQATGEITLTLTAAA